LDKILVTFQQILERGGVGEAVQPLFGRMLHRGGEGIVRRREGGAAAGPRGEADIGKAEITLLSEGDRGLRALFRMVEQAHEVVGLAPLPAGVPHLGEAGVFRLAAEVAEFRKNITRGREAVFDLALDRNRSRRTRKMISSHGSMNQKLRQTRPPRCWSPLRK
jgi:hypothetical protein